MITGRIKILTCLILVSFTSAGALSEDGFKIKESKQAKIRLSGSYARVRTLHFGKGLPGILEMHEYNRIQPSGHRFLTVMVDGYLAKMVLINPDLKIPHLKEISEIALEERKYTKIYNSSGPLAEKYMTAEAEACYYLYNKDFEKALDAYERTKIWLRKYNEDEKLRDKTISTINYNEGLYVQVQTEIEIIKAIMAKKRGEVYSPDPELFSAWKKNDFYDQSQPFFDYMGFLIVFNRTDLFKELVQFDLSRGPSHATLFYCREMGEVCFEWYDMHTYWLTPEFKKLLAELKKEVMSKTKAQNWPDR
ncbi:MAG TPA: hypothetical protein PLX41_11945 [Bacteroidales bacterium]|nr:hypothetical protein [Bacteroidales bacterium]